MRDLSTWSSRSGKKRETFKHWNTCTFLNSLNSPAIETYSPPSNTTTCSENTSCQLSPIYESLKSFVHKGSPLRSNHLSFFRPFLAEKKPLSCTSIAKWYPFHTPRTSLPLLLTLFQSWNATHSLSHFEPFYRPKWQISPPFHILQLVKPLPFHIPEAWKMYPFRVEPSRIGY